MSEEFSVQELMRQGIEAAREGRKEEAKELFQRVIEQEDKNEKAWMWLASVVSTDDERRVCLSNVLLINPANERAQALMAKLDEKAKQAVAEEEVIPGISRRQLLMVGGGGAAVVVLLIVAFLLITGSQSASIAAQTQAVVNTQNAILQAEASTQQVAQAATETQMALATPTPTASPTANRPTLPPEISLESPTPEPLATSTPLPYPSGIGGRIAGWSGRDMSQSGFLPIVIYTLDAGGQPVAISDSSGRNPDLSADGRRAIYTRYFPTTYDTGLEQIGLDGTNPLSVTIGMQDISKAQMPSYCRTQNQVVFVALPRDYNGPLNATRFPYQVYTFNFDTNTLFRLTNDAFSYTYPSYSPDCSAIAVVREELAGANTGSTDVYLINTTSLAQTEVTSDRGAFIEANPHWSPDGRQITYSAHPADQPENNDIVVRGPDQASTPIVVARSEANEIYPVFSPDGRYIAYASNQTGYYDIFILDRETNTTYQLTRTVEEDYPGSWAP